MNRIVTTYADAWRPTTRRLAVAYDAALVLGGSLIVALGAQIAVRLPFSPVPITLQTLAVLMVGALLGSRRGALSLLAYLAQGLAGLPVFAGGASGLAYAVGPTGGYLLGFVAAAYLTGRLTEGRVHRGFAALLSTGLAMAAGNLAIYACGLPWLALYVGRQAVALGAAPFLVGDALKIVICSRWVASAHAETNR